jgi:hypothetical protein
MADHAELLARPRTGTFGPADEVGGFRFGAPTHEADPIGKPTGMKFAVAASSELTDPDEVRRPGGEVHAWTPGTNQALCGLALSRSRLGRYPHVDWEDIRPESARHADEVRQVCPRCATGVRPRRPERRGQRAARRRYEAWG